ncbi:2-dehydro-3-deoxygalactonokinase [Phaeovulum sp.]|uniref:2-dehydro-3-deoxygalactonokinase n=1 Tax=Phaeovulum sp. TaxID=2934796 RepID=UPI0039E3E16B
MNDIRWIGAAVDGNDLRVWAGNAEGAALAQAAGQVAPGQDPFDAIATLAAPWRRPEGTAPLPILVAGLPEPAPAALPCPPQPARPTPASAPGFWRVGGLTQTKPQDRVTAAQALCLAGCLRGQPQFDGVICLTDAYGLWAHISAGEVVSVASTAAGTLAAAVGALPADIDLMAFDSALSDGLSRPEHLLRILATARQMPPGPAQARIWGALIGAELAAVRPWWLGQSVLVLGHGPLPELYTHALAAQSVHATAGHAEPALLAGFAAAAESLQR